MVDAVNPRAGEVLFPSARGERLIVHGVQYLLNVTFQKSRDSVCKSSMRMSCSSNVAFCNHQFAALLGRTQHRLTCNNLGILATSTARRFSHDAIPM